MSISHLIVMFSTKNMLIVWKIVSGWCLSRHIPYTTEHLAIISAL